MLSHRMSNTPEYKVWKSMRQRCGNPNGERWERYGGRGITVCDRWQVFENFYADMGARPSPDHEIERYDNNKGYEPGNCGWELPKVQQRNKNSNNNLTYNDKTQPVSAWAEELNIRSQVITMRLRRGWTVAEALNFAPPPPRIKTRAKIISQKTSTGQRPKNTIFWKGEERLFADVVRKVGTVPYDTANRRRSLGWPPERIFERDVAPYHGDLYPHPITGKLMHKAALAKEFGMDRSKLQGRLDAGWSLKDALTASDGRRSRYK